MLKLQNYNKMNEHEIIYKLRKDFNNVAKLIYVDPESYIRFEDEDKVEFQEIIPFPIDSCFYLILSQYFKKIKIKFAGEDTDLRLSFFLIRSSRTGKGQIIKVVEEVSKELNVTTKRISYLNQASLIGSLNTIAIEYNTTHGYTPIHTKYVNPVIFGSLAKYDILIFPEAKKLIKGTNEKETEFILSTLQEALDYPGKIDKELKYQIPISYESTSSILGTTYYIYEISRLLKEQGFFQRIVTYKSSFDLNQTKDMRSSIIEKFRQKNTTQDFKLKARAFANEIKKISNEEKMIFFSDEAVDNLQKFNDFYFSSISNVKGEELEILKSFSQTIIQTVVKIAGINCCLRGNKVIELIDLTTALSVFHKFVKTIIHDIATSDRTEATQKQSLIYLLKQFYAINRDFPDKKTFLDFVTKKGLTYNRAYATLNKLISENYIQVETTKKNKQILSFKN